MHGWHLLPARLVRATVIDGPRTDDLDAGPAGTLMPAAAAGAASGGDSDSRGAVDGLADDLSKLLRVSGPPGEGPGDGSEAPGSGSKAAGIDVRHLSATALEVATKAMIKAVAGSGLSAAIADDTVAPVAPSAVAPPAGCYVVQVDGRTADGRVSGTDAAVLTYDAFPHALVRFLSAAASAPACGLLRGLCMPVAGADPADAALSCGDVTLGGISVGIGGFQVKLRVVDPTPAAVVPPAAAAGAASASSAMPVIAGSPHGPPVTHCFIAPATTFEVVWPKADSLAAAPGSSDTGAARFGTSGSLGALTTAVGGFGGYDAEVALLQRLLASALLHPHVHTDAGLRPPR